MQQIERSPSILSDHHELQLDFNNWNYKEPTNFSKLNNATLIEYWVKADIKNKRHSRIQWKWIHGISKIMGHNGSRSKRKVHGSKHPQ